MPFRRLQLQMIQAKVKWWERAASSWLASYQSKQCSNEGFERLIWPWKTCYIILFKLILKSKLHFFKNRMKMFQYPFLSRLALSDKQFCSHAFCSFFPSLSCAILQQPRLEGTSKNHLVQPIEQSLTRSKKCVCELVIENELFTKSSLLKLIDFLKDQEVHFKLVHQ